MSKIRMAEGSAPATPAAGKVVIYVDSADSHVKQKDDTGTVLDLAGGGGGAGSDTTAIHDDTSGEIAAISVKGTPVSGDLLLIEDSASANAKKRITVGSLPSGGGGDPTVTTVVVTGDTTTTSTSDILMSSMTITPGAGNYLALFGAEIELGNPDDAPTISIYANSALISGSYRTGTEKKNSFTGLETHAVITSLGAGQAIEGRWKTSDGETITAGHRRLTIIKVA